MKRSSQFPVYLMVFLSGFAGLVYQVLWMRQLGLLFGNTSHAAAVTLAVFFGGLAAGSWFWGKCSTRIQRPLRAYGGLELGIAVTALVYFWVLSLFHAVYPAVYQSVGPGCILLLIKCGLACMLVFPPAFCMGGTIPVMGQYLVRQQERFAVTTAMLYGINTIGAALGAFIGAFYLVGAKGFNKTCKYTMAITGIVAVTALILSCYDRGETEATVGDQSGPEKRSKKKRSKSQAEEPLPVMSRPLIYAMCFLSGFSVLTLEVVWTRMFAQVHENSVYSFASVLVIVLVCLSLGALVSSLLARYRLPATQMLSALMLASGIALAICPINFINLTNNLEMMATSTRDSVTQMPVAISFFQYVTHLFVTGFIAIGPSCLLLGTVFPYLMKSEQAYARNPGKSIGLMSAVNTFGAILGSLLCGFVLLRLCGMWWTIQLLAIVYLVCGLLLPATRHIGSMAMKIAGALFLLMIFTGLNPSDLPVIGYNKKSDPDRVEQVERVWETSDCTVAVVKIRDEYRRREDYLIKVNSNYSLGSTGAVPLQVFQTRVPLYVYPSTESIFYLGLGSGITAGAALDTELFPKVQRVVACELVPEVVTAARIYMTKEKNAEDYTNGLFDDPRVKILIEDGRHYLMASDQTFDMINADLFLPYRSGAGSLYSREHFEDAKKRLNPGGVFVQWVPLYQVTEFELGVIARTMLTVFEQVTMWRNNFQPGSEVVALIGHSDSEPLPACNISVSEAKRVSVAGRNWEDLQRLFLPFNEQTIMLFYCGNISKASEFFESYPINTDDKPVIEYRAPLSLRNEIVDGMPPVFIGPRFADLVDKLIAACPPETDPMLINRTKENRRLVRAGTAFHHAWIGAFFRNHEKWRKSWDVFVREWTNQ